jgi:aspartate kinase
LAAALDAEACEIYSDVDGIYNADPRVVLDAKRLETITYDEMLTLARHGARVMNADAVAYARQEGIALFAKSAHGPTDQSGTIIRLDPPTDPPVITGIAQRSDAWRLSLRSDRTEHDASSSLSWLPLFLRAELYPDHCQATGQPSTGLDLIFTEENHPGLNRRLQEIDLPEGVRVASLTAIETVTLAGHAIPEHASLFQSMLDVAQKEAGPVLSGLLIEPLAITFMLDRTVALQEGTTGVHAASLSKAFHKNFLSPTHG